MLAVESFTDILTQGALETAATVLYLETNCPCWKSDNGMDLCKQI